MIYRCDIPMRNKKENTDPFIQDANQWRCDNNCQRCICALKKNDNGTWEHVNTNSKVTKRDDECLYLERYIDNE